VIENVGLLNFKTELFVRSSSQLYHRCCTATFRHRFKLNYDFQGFLMGHLNCKYKKGCNGYSKSFHVLKSFVKTKNIKFCL